MCDLGVLGRAILLTSGAIGAESPEKPTCGSQVGVYSNLTSGSGLHSVRLGWIYELLDTISQGSRS